MTKHQLDWVTRKPRTASPQRIHQALNTKAVYIGGLADGWITDVPLGSTEVWVTMVDGGPPKTLPLYTHPRTLLEPVDLDPDKLMERAFTTWELYVPVIGLPTDRQGRRVYWARRPRPTNPDSLVHLITPDLIADAERAIRKARERGFDTAGLWDIFRLCLAAAIGYELPLLEEPPKTP